MVANPFPFQGCRKPPPPQHENFPYFALIDGVRLLSDYTVHSLVALGHRFAIFAHKSHLQHNHIISIYSPMYVPLLTDL